MKYWPLILTGTCALSIACNSSDTSSKKDGVHCPDFLLKGQGLPSESILIGVLSGSKIKLRSGALITKTGSNLQEHVWDEETLYFEDSPDSSFAETYLDTSQIDPYLKCAYLGKVDPVKKEYFDIELLIPIRPHASGRCKFVQNGPEVSATCEYNH